MLLKLQQRGNNAKPGAAKGQHFSEQKHVLNRNPSDLVEAEQQQDISPLKISFDGAQQDDGYNLPVGEIESPWRGMGDPPRSKTETLSDGKGKDEVARPQLKQDDVPNIVRPFEPEPTEASIYSFQ